MKNILVVGLGKIGIRHFESVLKLKEKTNIILIDLNKFALKECQIIAQEKKSIHNISFSEEIPENSIFDIAIIATDAKPRFQLAKQLIEKNLIKNFLLEKVVFINSFEYETFFNLLKSKNIQCFVNHPRRLYKHFIELKKLFINETQFEINIFGDNWGLASNLLHFTDLIQFLFNQNIETIECLNSSNFFSSKRKGYKELNATFLCKYPSNSSAYITSGMGSFEGIMIQIKTPNSNVIIYEGSESYLKISNNSDFQMIHNKYVIETTIETLESLFNDQMLLPTFHEVMVTHVKFIKTLENIYCSQGNKDELRIS
jgi:predicted dehydrogenase